MCFRDRAVEIERGRVARKARRRGPDLPADEPGQLGQDRSRVRDHIRDTFVAGRGIGVGIDAAGHGARRRRTDDAGVGRVQRRGVE